MSTLVFRFFCKSHDSEKTVEWFITKLGLVMDLGPSLGLVTLW